MVKNTKHSSLSKDILFLSIVIVFILLLASLWVAYQSYEDYADINIAQLENESIRVDRSLIVEIKNLSYLVESLGRRISQINDRDAEEISKLLRSFDNNADGNQDVFSWINQHQMISISSNQGVLAKPIDISDRDYIKKALTDPWNIQIGRPILARVSNRWVLPISMGMTDYNGKHIGAIVANLDIKKLTQEIEKELGKSTSSYSILSKTLISLTEVNHSEDKLSNEDILHVKKLVDIDTSKRKTGVLSKASLFKQNNSFAVYESSDKYPYIIVIGHENSLHSTNLVKMLLPRFVELTLNALFLLFILWLVRGRVLEPVEMMSDALSEMLKGKNYNVKIPNAPVEIEELSEKIKTLDSYIIERERIMHEVMLKNSLLLKVKDSAQVMNKVRTQFLGKIAQELSGPVHLIQDYTESIVDQRYGPIANGEYVKQAVEVMKNSRELKQMISDIKSISELDQDGLIISDRPVNVSFVIHKTIRSFMDQPINRNIDIKLRQDDALPFLVIDEGRLGQILLNLFAGAASQLSNAGTMVLECFVDSSEFVSDREYVFMLKYNVHNDDYEDENKLITGKNTVLASGKKSTDAPLLINSEGINLELTRMLVSLYQGEMKTKISTNKVCRIYIRFPASRIRDEAEEVVINEDGEEIAVESVTGAGDGI